MGGDVCLDNLVCYFVYKEAVCSRNRLEKRLDSLAKFGFLTKSVCRRTVFYELVIPASSKEM